MAGTTEVRKVLYTPIEAAAALSVSRTQLFRLLRTGELESVLVAGPQTRRIPAQALDDYVARRRAAS